MTTTKKQIGGSGYTGQFITVTFGTERKSIFESTDLSFSNLEAIGMGYKKGTQITAWEKKDPFISAVKLETYTVH